MADVDKPRSDNSNKGKGKFNGMERENTDQAEDGFSLHDNNDFDSDRFEPVWIDTQGYPGTIPPEIGEFFPEDNAPSRFKSSMVVDTDIKRYLQLDGSQIPDGRSGQDHISLMWYASPC